MKTSHTLLLLPLAVALAFAPAAQAQSDGQTYASMQIAPAFSQQELDSMLAPIALYPDSLLSQILMASTYPLEVVEAARWSRAHPGLHGDAAVRAVEYRDWDPSVMSLVAFPQILSMMEERLDWTEQLGNAFLAQETRVMDTVQLLRDRAYRAGYLRSDEQIRVEPREGVYYVEPAQAQYVYVPYYDPLVVYGAWWWPSHPPVYWAPWPGYHARTGLAVFAWGSAIPVSAGFFFGDFDWHRHHARVVNVNNYYYNRTVIVNNSTATRVNAAPGAWQHDPDHRRGAPYRDAALRERFAGGTTVERRGEERSRDGHMGADNRAREMPGNSEVRSRDVQPGAENRPREIPRSVEARPEARPEARTELRGADNSGHRPAALAPNPRAEPRAETRTENSRRDAARAETFANVNSRAETRASRPEGVPPIARPQPAAIAPPASAPPARPALEQHARVEAAARPAEIRAQTAHASAAPPSAPAQQPASAPAPHQSGNGHGGSDHPGGDRANQQK